MTQSCPTAALLGLVVAGCATVPAREPAPDALARAGQLLLVVSTDWTAPDGQLRRFERAAGELWKPVGLPVAVMLGKSGLGWGRGLHGSTTAEPTKREGDGRAPAGVFEMGPAFGAGPAPEGLRLPWVTATSTAECVDDPKAARYNELVDTAVTPKDWQSSEELLRKDGLYALGLFVRHNSAPAVVGGGSCIFLHIWKGPGQPTVGCTAMAAPQLREVLLWLDPARSPVLVQLPAAELEARRAAWKLP